MKRKFIMKFLKTKKWFSDKVEEISPDQVDIITENLNKIEEQSKKFRSKYKNIKNHPWYGFCRSFRSIRKKELIKDLNKLNDFFEKISSETQIYKKISKY